MNRLTLCLLLLSAPLLAEGGAVSTILYLENEVTILPADGSNALQAGLNIPLYPGDRLDTARSGRLEAALAEGSLLWVDQRSQIELRALARTEGFSDQRSYLYLQEGQAAFEVPFEPARGEEPVLGFAGGDFYAFAPGLYAVELRGRAAYLRLFSGKGELVTDRGSVLLQAGVEAIASEDGFVDRRRLRPEADGFAGWVEQRRQLRLRSESASHTGDALSSYAYQLDQNGSWVYLPDIGGYAWRPVVAVGWQPYYDGYWWSSPGGWYWVGNEPWGYVTYHYGRWSMFPGYGWMWVPGYEWAPAWVYWYWDPFNIGWCPLGYWDYWWWSGCHSDCWGWDDHHHHNDYLHINGHVNLSRLDHRPFVFAPVDQFGKGRAVFTRGGEFKGRLDGQGTLRALDLPLRRSDLGDPAPVLRKASVDLKSDLTPLFKKDFTVTPQVRQILTEARAKGLERAAAPDQALTGRPEASPRGGVRSVDLPSGKAPVRQPLRDRSVTPSGSPSRPYGGTVTPSSPSPSSGRGATPSTSPRSAPRTLPSSGRTAPSPSGKVTPSPSSQSAPSPSPKVAPAPSPQPAPQPVPSEGKPSKSALRVTNVHDDGGEGTLRVEDPSGRLLARNRQSGSAPVGGDPRWDRTPIAAEESEAAPTGRRPVVTGSSGQPRPLSYDDRQPVSVPSTGNRDRDVYSPSYYDRNEAAAPSRPTYDRTPVSEAYSERNYERSYAAPSRPTYDRAPVSEPYAYHDSGRSYSAPSPSYSTPSNSGHTYSAPAPSSGGRASGSYSAPSVSSHSAPSSGSSSSSSSSSSSVSSSHHSAPKK